MPSPAALIDVRLVPPPQRHPLIFSTFDALPTGGCLELVNDHDPLPLYMEFERARVGQFDWRYLEDGPEQWRVRIGRVAPGDAATAPSGCGGACGCGGR
jgi:uncharacterized protein (DUF2249 family)